MGRRSGGEGNPAGEPDDEKGKKADPRRQLGQDASQLSRALMVASSARRL